MVFGYIAPVLPNGIVKICKFHGYLVAEQAKRVIKNSRPNGYWRCLQCEKTANAKWREKGKIWKKNNPEKVKALKKTEKALITDKNNVLKKKYGISLIEFERIKSEQGNVCFICQKPETVKDGRSGTLKRLSVDHCHKRENSGFLMVRALLCSKCNAVLGLANEDISILEKMIGYLKSHE